MARPLRAVVRLMASAATGSVASGILVLAAIAATATLAVLSPPAAATPGCDLMATTSTFTSVIAAAAPGQTVCLASGNYGTWAGTAKAITVTAATGATPQMMINFGSGANGFTLEHMSGIGGCISAGAANITIQYSTFATGTNLCGPGNLTIEGAVTNIVINANDFSYPVQSTSSGANSKIFLDTTGASPGAAATIENNAIENGDLDGVHIGDGSGDLIAGNTFENLCDRGVNHTDNIQFEGGSGIAVQGNYVYEAQACPTQGITSYDGDTNGLLIEDNVVDVPRDWGIELYSDKNSVVVHNTVVWHAKSYSEFNSGTGQIDVDRKSSDPAGSGTHVYDNIAVVGFTNGSTGSADHNVSGASAVYVGPLTLWSGYRLSPLSPVGRNAASDGLNDGARIPAPQPASTSAPSPTAAAPGSSAHAPAGSSSLPTRAKTLVLSFGFDERSGAIVADHSGLGNSGRLHRAQRTRAGRHGRGLLLARRAGYVTVRNSRSLQLTSAVTLAAWVRPTAGGKHWRSVIVKQGSGHRTAYGIFADDARGNVAAAINVRTRHTLHTKIHLRLRRWTYLAFTYDGRAARIYVNGALKAAQKMRGAIRAGSGPLMSGDGGTPGGSFNGVLDDVRIWNRALSRPAIRAQMKVDASSAS